MDYVAPLNYPELSESAFIPLYFAVERPHLEYAIQSKEQRLGGSIHLRFLYMDNATKQT